jgi:hypothetical protein
MGVGFPRLHIAVLRHQIYHKQQAHDAQDEDSPRFHSTW